MSAVQLTTSYNSQNHDARSFHFLAENREEAGFRLERQATTILYRIGHTSYVRAIR